MKRIILNDKLIIQIMEKYKESNKKEQLDKYIKGVIANCAQLCVAEIPIRVINELKFMFENLVKELDV